MNPQITAFYSSHCKYFSNQFLMPKVPEEFNRSDFPTTRWTMISRVRRGSDAEATQASALISERSAQPLWGWKDPRTALFLDFWNGLLPGAGYLFIYRNPLDVLLSLMRRNEPYMAGLLEGLEAWYAYNIRLLRFAAAHPERCILCSVGGVLASSKRLQPGLSSLSDSPTAQSKKRLADFTMSPSPPPTDMCQ